MRNTLLALALISAVATTAHARGRADDGPGHKAREDRTELRHGADNSAEKRRSRSVRGNRHGADDPAGHNAGDDRGQHRGGRGADG